MNITTRPATADDLEITFYIKKKAMRTYIEAHWGWDESTQRMFHRTRLADRPFTLIYRDDEVIGTMWVEQFDDHWRLGEFYLLPEHQNQGIGSQLIAKTIQRADASGAPIRLEHLKGNPVDRLYKRHGFVQIREDDTHIYMERPPSTNA